MESEEVLLKVNGQQVVGNYFAPRNTSKNQAVLFLHGWAGKPNTHAAAFLAEHGYHAFTIYFRGHAPSEGDIKSITTDDSLADAETAYDYLQTRLPLNAPVAVAGNSYGGYIAALLSVKRALNGLSLRVPANYPDENRFLPKWGRGNDDPSVAAWRQKKHEYATNAALKAVHNFRGKIQVIEAELDDQIAHQTVQNYVDAASDPNLVEYHFMRGWPHSLSDDKERNQEFKELLLAWLGKL